MTHLLQRDRTKKGPDHPGAGHDFSVTPKSRTQGAKDFPQGLAERTFASSDRTRRWTCLLRVQYKHGRSTRLHNNRLHQTCRPVNQFEHVCAEECPLTTRHTASRSGDSCEESQRLSFGGTAAQRSKQEEAGPRQDAAKEAAGTSVARAKQTKHAYIRTQVGHLNRITSAHDSRPHSLSGEPTERTGEVSYVK